MREDTPERHREQKSGTPTFGGLAILLAVVAGATLLPPPGRGTAMALLLCSLPFALLGAADDFLKAGQREKVVGVKARYKISFQLAFGLLASVYILRAIQGARPEVGLPFDGWLSLPAWGKVALDTLVFVGATNAVNLTDGLDGLAAGLAAICSLSLLALAPGAAGPSGLLVGLLGACLGFLWFNVHPARIFMGDTGSLFLGALLAAFSCASGLEFHLFIAGLVFVAEALSVILQVLYFKATGGRRIFKMAPLHHHFELSGWPEPQIVARFWLAGAAAGGLAIAAKGG